MEVCLDDGPSRTPDDRSARALAAKPGALRRTALQLRGIDGSARRKTLPCRDGYV
jgi:hypothetical protein